MKSKTVALAVLVGFSTLSVQANELPNGPHIVTSGTASVGVTPGIATLTVEMNAAAKGTVSAERQAGEHVTQYLSLLERNQIAGKGISATNLHIQPDYDYQNGKSVPKGYHAVHTVEITLRQLDKLNALLDDALRIGLNEIHSVSLGIAQPDTYEDKARKAAIDDAIHQTEQLATGLNNRLGPVHSVYYHAFNYQPNPMVRIMKTDTAPATSAQGTYERPVIQLDDQVDMVFQIELTAG